MLTLFVRSSYPVIPTESMDMNMDAQAISWDQLTAEEKKVQLFLNQKQTLDLFLERGAISQAQYDKSLGDLREKMGVKE